MELNVAGYVPKVATEGHVDRAGKIRRGSVILMDP